jgi:hypothetical protein
VAPKAERAEAVQPPGKSVREDRRGDRREAVRPNHAPNSALKPAARIRNDRQDRRDATARTAR